MAVRLLTVLIQRHTFPGRSHYIFKKRLWYGQGRSQRGARSIPLSVLPQYNTHWHDPVCLLEVNIPPPPKENPGYGTDGGFVRWLVRVMLFRD